MISSIDDILNLNIDEGFGPNEDGDSFTPSFNHLYDQLDSHALTTTWGATKFVIIFNNSDRVVKIPFRGSYYIEELWDEETDDYTIEHEEFRPFYCDDYCEREANLYLDAVDNGVQQFFAETRYEGATKSGYPIYTAEKVSEFQNDNCKKPSKDSKTIRDNLYEEYGNVPYDWLGYAIEYYGEKACLKLLEFIEEYDIRDLHGGNVGFRPDGSPCILDYSSYLE